MPKRTLPRTHAERSHVLRKASLKGNATALAQHAIPAELWARLNRTSATADARIYLNGLTAITARTQELSASTELVAPALAIAGRAISHFFQVFDLAILRKKWPISHREYHGRNKHATTVPEIISNDDALLWAARIAEGEAERQTDEAGAFVPMAMPTAAEVAAEAAVHAALLPAHTTRHDALTDAEQLVTNLLPGPDGIDALILDLYDSVEHHYRKLPDGARRDKCREWGLLYEGDAVSEDPGGGGSSSSSSSSSSTAEPLTAVQNVGVQTGSIGSGTANISWDQNPAAQEVEEYEALEDGAVIGTAAGDAGSLEITGREPGSSLTVTVRARRGASTGPQSEPVTGTAG